MSVHVFLLRNQIKLIIAYKCDFVNQMIFFILLAAIDFTAVL